MKILLLEERAIEFGGQCVPNCDATRLEKKKFSELFFIKQSNEIVKLSQMQF